MPPRWTDDRLDDLATLVRQNTERLSLIRREVDRHEDELKDIASYGDRRQNRHWQLSLLLLTVTLSAIANVVATIVR